MPTGPRPAPPAGTAKVTVSGTNFTHKWNNIFYLSLSGSGITSTDLDTLASTIATAWGTAWNSKLSDSATQTSVGIVYIPTAGTEVVGSWTGTNAGTRTSAQLLDASAAYVISWKTGQYYRGGHPRWYVAGVATTDITSGSAVGSTIRGQIATNLATFRGTVNSATTTHVASATMGTVSFQTGKEWRSPPIFVAFGSVTVSAVLGSQRRRIHS